MCGDSITHLNLIYYTVIINCLMCDFTSLCNCLSLSLSLSLVFFGLNISFCFHMQFGLYKFGLPKNRKGLSIYSSFLLWIKYKFVKKKSKKKKKKNGLAHLSPQASLKRVGHYISDSPV